MREVFNKGLNEADQKEGYLKKSKNIEDKNEKQLKATEDFGKNNWIKIQNH